MKKTFLLIWLPVAILVGGILGLIYYSESKYEKTILETNETNHVKYQIKSVSADLDHVVSDLIILSEQHELQELLKAENEFSSKDLANDYLSLSLRKGLYDQIRFIDEKGMEAVRVNYSDCEPCIVPDKELQFKGNRYYFRDTFELDRGEVFVSPFDLNIERGTIEKPFKPMIRFGTPVFDGKGRKKGIVVLNYFGSVLLDNIREMSSKPGKTMLLNSDGYWLLSPNPEDEWGFMLEDRKDKRFGNAFPHAWQRISGRSSGQFYNADGLFTFATIYPLLEGQKSSTGSAEPFAPSASRLGSKDYSWKIVSHVTHEALYQRLHSLFWEFVQLYAVLLVLAAIASWLIAKANLRHKEAEDALRESETKFHSIFESSNDAIMLLDEKGFFDCNDATLNMFDCNNRDEFCSRHPSDFSPPKQINGEDSRKAADERISQAFNEGRNFFEWMHCRNNGEDFPAEVLLTSLTLKGRKVLQATVRDITERKLAEEALKESERKYRSLAESTKTIPWKLDLATGRFTYIGRQVEEILGFPAESWVDMNTWSERIHPEDREDATKFCSEATKRGEDHDFEYRSVAADGSVVWIRDIVSVVQENKVPKELIGVMIDITERKNAEEGLRKLSTIVEQNPASIVITDTKGTIEYVNPKFEQVTGYTAMEAIGQNPRVLKSGEQSDAFYKELWDTITSGKDWRGDFRNKKKNGELYWESASISPVKDAEGNITHFLAIKVDVTSRKKMEEEIRRNNQIQLVLNSLLNISLEDITIEELLGRCLDVILSVPFVSIHPTGAIFIVKENTEILTMGAQKGIDDKLQEQCKIDLPFGRCLCGRAAASRRVEFADCVDNRHDIHFEGMAEHGHYCVPIISKGRVLGVITLYLDEGHARDEEEVIFLQTVAATMAGILERKKMEGALRNAKEVAEEATRLKDKFVSLVSHDLKNPIHRIMGYYELLESTQQISKQGKELIQEGLFACKDMTTLIDEILNLSRIKGGRIMPEYAFINAGKLADSAIKDYTLMASEKGIELINDIPKDARIYADEKLLVEVVRNLISNSVKFCEKGDTIRLYLPDGEADTIAVADTGRGMEVEWLKTVFKYEEKTSTTGTSGESGTGFGLPLARDIMKAHGGDLQVESTRDEGSTFYASLPHVRPKVLIVDDDKLNIRMLKDFLVDLDLDFIQAGNGREAVDALEKTTPHLILQDIIMPDMDGFELLQHVRSKKETKTTPVIVITADKEIETRDRVFDLGADDFITKPFNTEDLIPRVRRFVG